MQPIKMDLSQEQKTFCHLLLAFFKSTSNFKDFQKRNFCIALCIFKMYIEFSTSSRKHDRHTLCISEVTDSERPGYIKV